MFTKSISFALSALAITAAAATPACSSADSTKESAADTRSAITVTSAMIVGSLDFPQTTATTTYTSTPAYRAYKFGGSAGDKVDVWVRSNDGDALAWILDDNFHTLATNDDASASTTDSHMTWTVAAGETFTHYVVFRDYYRATSHFTVQFTGTKATPDFTSSCHVDADCVVVAKNCCTNLGNTSVLQGDEQAYRDSLHCPSPQICPLIMTRNDHGTAECNVGTHKCEYVLPADVACGGRSLNPHACPTGFSCQGPQLLVDGQGKCLQTCGGIAGRTCDNVTDTCVDDPNDSCDPAHGGADCGGICKSCTPTNCGINGRWDSNTCSCVVQQCVDTVACTRYSHWDSTACACVANPTGCTYDSDCASPYASCVQDPNNHCDWNLLSCKGICVR